MVSEDRLAQIARPGYPLYEILRDHRAATSAVRRRSSKDIIIVKLSMCEYLQTTTSTENDAVIHIILASSTSARSIGRLLWFRQS
ncbi:5898_t:CDS:2 [Ambispora gerdemannii]|uniref:5898_t:CDS:1 n=1 Tax=Ambispora gerdemannii TaxID=144530 RepID=A0A9N8W9E1_9GLOM|nr:5898_t:CDS:2 [Ambispora gerdemannii]